MKSYCEILDAAASESPEKPLFVFPESRWRGEEVLTYGQLASRSAMAAGAIQRYAKPGDRVLLMFSAGARFWESFFGCLASGVIAVPLNLPNLNRSSEHLQNVCLDCAPALMITDQKSAELLDRRAERHPWRQQLPVLTPDAWQDGSGSLQILNVAANATAFLQYTSGSTARPKGVQISHQNLFANSQMIRDTMQIRIGSDLGVTWLPHYHDMGLVGSYLETLFTRNTSVCLSPEEFVLQPGRWLQLISQYRANISGGPDFAFRMCTEKISEDQLADLDLSEWRIAYIGAERIRTETVRGFLRRFGPVGFRETTFFPCYGLGEATLLAAGGPADVAPVYRQVSTAALMQNRVEHPTSRADVSEFVSSGKIVDGLKIVIADPETGAILADGAIGEVLLSGQTVTDGYFLRGDLGDSVFRSLVFDGAELRFLRTGDLGFLADADLFVVGRTKEIIIVRGRNLFPEDIEAALTGTHGWVIPGNSVAFAAELSGSESLIIAIELPRSAVNMSVPGELFTSIRQTIVTRFGVSPAEVLLVSPASLPRTSSGKLRRTAVGQDYVTDQMKCVSRDRL